MAIIVKDKKTAENIQHMVCNNFNELPEHTPILDGSVNSLEHLFSRHYHSYCVIDVSHLLRPGSDRGIFDKIFEIFNVDRLGRRGAPVRPGAEQQVRETSIRMPPD